MEQQSKTLTQLLRKHGKPLFGYSFMDRTNEFMKVLQDNRVPVLPSPERAARCMRIMVEHARFRKKNLIGFVSLGVQNRNIS